MLDILSINLTIPKLRNQNISWDVSTTLCWLESAITLHAVIIIIIIIMGVIYLYVMLFACTEYAQDLILPTSQSGPTVSKSRTLIASTASVRPQDNSVGRMR